MANVQVTLDTDTLDEWRCPECGAVSYTMKAQAVLMIWCAKDHGMVYRDGKAIGQKGVYMQRVNERPDPDPLREGD